MDTLPPTRSFISAKVMSSSFLRPSVWWETKPFHLGSSTRRLYMMSLTPKTSRAVSLAASQTR